LDSSLDSNENEVRIYRTPALKVLKHKNTFISVSSGCWNSYWRNETYSVMLNPAELPIHSFMLFEKLTHTHKQTNTKNKNTIKIIFASSQGT